MIATTLKSRRKQLGMTQYDVAIGLSISPSLVGMWERGKRLPRADKLPEIARLYGCTVDELFGEV